VRCGLLPLRPGTGAGWEGNAFGRISNLSESGAMLESPRALGELGDASGLPVLRSMLDRASLAREKEISSEQAEGAMVNALKALVLLRDAESLPTMERLAREDPNLRVRDAARKAVDAIRPKSSKRLERSDAVLVG
jgi:hypothetical protein